MINIKYWTFLEPPPIARPLFSRCPHLSVEHLGVPLNTCIHTLDTDLLAQHIKSCCYPRLPLIPHHQIFSWIVWNVLIYYYKTFILQTSWRYTRISLLWPIWTLHSDPLFLVGGRHTIITCEKWRLPIWK